MEPLGIGVQTLEVLQIRHYIRGRNPLFFLNNTIPSFYHIMRYFQSVKFARLFEKAYCKLPIFLFWETGSTNHNQTEHRWTQYYMTMEPQGANIHITCNISTRRMMRSACLRQVRKPWMHKTWNAEDKATCQIRANNSIYHLQSERVFISTLK